MDANPRSYSVFYNAGNLFMETGKYDDSISAYRRALKLRTKNRGVFINLALVYRKAGRYKRADRVYRYLLQKNKNDAIALRDAGLLYLKNLKRVEKGKEYLKKYLKLRPKAKDASAIRKLVR